MNRINTKGLIFHVPLTNKYLQPGDLPSDISAQRYHCVLTSGSPTFSSTGVTPDGQIRFPATGIFENTKLSIMFRFNPTFAPTDNVDCFFYDSTFGGRYYMRHYGVSLGSFLLFYMNNTFIASVAPGQYSPYWNQNDWNTLVITSESGDTSVWLNGNQIVTNDSSAWTANDRSNFWIGSVFNGGGVCPAEFSDFRIYNRIISTTERLIFEKSYGLTPRILSSV